MSMAHITHSTTDNTESPLSTYHDQEAQQQTLKRCGWSKLNDHSSSIPLRSISVWLWSPIRLLTFSCPGALRDIFSAQPQFTPALWRVSLHGKYPIRMLLRARRPVCSWCDYGLLVPRFHFIVLPPFWRIYGDFGCVNKTLSALIRSDRNWTKSVVKSTKRLHESLNEICF